MTLRSLASTLELLAAKPKLPKAATLAIGVGVGTAIGVATDNLGLWLALGVAIGAAIGVVQKK